MARAGAEIGGIGEMPLSPAAGRELEVAVGEFKAMVRARAVEHARRQYLHEVSELDVRAALHDSHSAGSRKRWRGALFASLGWLLGSLFLGGGVNRALAWVGSGAVDPASAAVTLGLTVTGVVCVAVVSVARSQR